MIPALVRFAICYSGRCTARYFNRDSHYPLHHRNERFPKESNILQKKKNAKQKPANLKTETCKQGNHTASSKLPVKRPCRQYMKERKKLHEYQNITDHFHMGKIT